MREDLEKGDLLRGGEAENQIIYSLLPAVDEAVLPCPTVQYLWNHYVLGLLTQVWLAS